MKSLGLRASKARLLMLIVTIASFSLLSGSIGQESFKIGVVNTQNVLEGYKKAAEAIETLQAHGGRLEESLNALEDEIRTLREKKAKTELFVEQAQTADLEAEILRKQQEYQRKAQESQQGLLDEEKKLMEPIYKDIRERIIEVGKADGYDLILEKGLIVLYVDERHDLTQRLISSLNESAE